METPPHVITLGGGYPLYWFVLLRIVESDIYYFEIDRLIYTLNTFLSLILVRLSTSSQFILIMWHELFVRYVMKIYILVLCFHLTEIMTNESELLFSW